jgi:hypothetical protein
MIIRVSPKAFHDIYIRARGWPVEGGDVIFFEPTLCSLGCMLWIVISLKGKIMLVGVEVLLSPKILFPKDGDISCRIHLAIDVTKSANPMSCNIPPHYQLPMSMLHLFLGVMGV